MTDYIKILTYYNNLAENTFNPTGTQITVGIIGAIFVFILLLALGSLFRSLGNKASDADVIFYCLCLVLLPFFTFFTFTVPGNKKVLDKPEYLTEVKKYNVNSLENLKDNINLLKEELKFSTSNTYDEINKVLNDFYKSESSDKNKNVSDELIKKLKN
jgi:hypothetical protein